MLVTQDQRDTITTLYLKAVMDYKFAHGLIEGTYRIDNLMWREQKDTQPYPKWAKAETHRDDGTVQCSLFDEQIVKHNAQRDEAAQAGMALQQLALTLSIDLPDLGRFYTTSDGRSIQFSL